MPRQGQIQHNTGDFSAGFHHLIGQTELGMAVYVLHGAVQYLVADIADLAVGGGVWNVQTGFE